MNSSFIRIRSMLDDGAHDCDVVVNLACVVKVYDRGDVREIECADKSKILTKSTLNEVCRVMGGVRTANVPTDVVPAAAPSPKRDRLKQDNSASSMFGEPKQRGPWQRNQF